MTTHDPVNVFMFPKTPRTYGKEIPEINNIEKPVLTELGKSLCGY